MSFPAITWTPWPIFAHVLAKIFQETAQVLPSKLANFIIWPNPGFSMESLYYMFLFISNLQQQNTPKTSQRNPASVSICECCRHPAPMAAASSLMAASSRASHKAAVVGHVGLAGGILGPTTPPGKGRKALKIQRMQSKKKHLEKTSWNMKQERET